MGMEQLEFYFNELPELKTIVKSSYLAVKKKYPKPVEGETFEEYHIFIRDEVLLEIAERLKRLALERQERSISILFKRGSDD